MKIIQVNEDREDQPELIECPNCQEVMSYRVVENLWTYFNYDKEDKVFFKHVDGTYEEKYYECLECGHKEDGSNSNH